MTSRSARILNGVSRVSVAVLLAAMPLFFFPLTVDALEVPKQFLLAFLTLLALVVWVGRVVVARSLVFRRTPFDIPLLGLWVVLLLATLTSRDRLTSLLGNYENYTLSFLSFTFLIVLYFLLVQMVHTRKDAALLLFLISVSGAIAEIFFIVKALVPGAVSWIPIGNLSNTVSTFASTFGLFVIVQILIALGMVCTKREEVAAKDIWYTFVLVLSLATLVLIGFKPMWFLLAIAMFFFLIYAVSRVEDLRFVWVSASFTILVVSILLAFFGMPRFLTASLPTEISLSPGTSWTVASGALTSDVKSFLVGSGPGTFGLDFSRFRPESFNSNFAWNIRFSQPYSTAIEMISATGVLGAITWIAVILLALGTIFLFWIRRVGIRGVRRAADGDEPAEHLSLFWAITASWFTMMVASFMFVFGAVSWVMFFTLLALLVALSLSMTRGEEAFLTISLKASPQYALLVSFSFILVFTAAVVFGIFLGRFLTAEIAYASGSRAAFRGDTEIAIREMARASSLHPQRHTYHLALAQTYLLHAAQLSAAGQADTSTLTSLLAAAIGEGQRATSLTPNDAGGWQQLAVMYANARPVAPEANAMVVQALERAIALERTNPTLYLLLGDARVADRQPEEAIKQYEKAIQLKPDYVQPYMSIALLEEQIGKQTEAITHMAQATLVAPGNVDAIFNLGRLLYNRGDRGDLERAEQAFQTVLNIDPNYANAIFSLGLISERRGNIRAALDFYRRVLELNPGDTDVKKKIQSLSAPPPASE